MRFLFVAAGAALLLTGCLGPDGNPNGQAYANEDGGTIAVAPGSVNQESYDPYAKADSFEDMRAGGAGANQPSPTGNKPLPH